MVRHGRYSRFGRAAAAIALYNLQSQAPAGGAGNRTSMRGGGPLITLVEPRHADSATTLYDVVWANVPAGRRLEADQLSAAFPWMRPTLTSLKGEMVHFADRQRDAGDTPARVEAFFGMPRRLRLIFDEAPGVAVCDLTGAYDAIQVTGVVQRPSGTNYGVWRHPLSPYYTPDAGAAALPVHPKPGRFGFRNWLGVTLQSREMRGQQRAEAVQTYLDGRGRSGIDVPNPALLVAGWAMKIMSPLDFVSAHLPLLLADDPAGQRDLEDRAYSLVEAGQLAQRQLIGACKSLQHDADTDKGDLSQVGDNFFGRTEDAMFAALGRLHRDPERAAPDLATALRAAALAEFEILALPALSELPMEKASTVVAAHRQLG